MCPFGVKDKCSLVEMNLIWMTMDDLHLSLVIYPSVSVFSPVLMSSIF